MTLNPFRIQRVAREDSRLLIQSILALCSQHQVSTGKIQPMEALEKRTKACEMLSQAMQKRTSAIENSHLLEVVLILITLDVSTIRVVSWSNR